jgi:REP element-mobilizing transposase RayT
MNESVGEANNGAVRSLPHRDARRYDRAVIGSHLILYGYGLWLPNDPRGSGSDILRQVKLADLGPVHHGRRHDQPLRSDLKSFYQAAGPRLEFPTIWFDEAMRQAIGEAFAHVVAKHRFTVWSCAILRNHAHLCIRRHRDDPVIIWRSFAKESASAIHAFPNIPNEHPVWSNRPYKVFLKSPNEIRRVVAYIENNPKKDALPTQSWPFVTRYDGWPHRSTTAR